MTLKVELNSSQIASLVNGNTELKAAVLAEYLSQNAPELDITDLQPDSEKQSPSATEISDESPSVV